VCRHAFQSSFDPPGSPLNAPRCICILSECVFRCVPKPAECMLKCRYPRICSAGMKQLENGSVLF
jgi:hypothetical protein